MAQRVVVLDAGGVLVTEPVPQLLADIARRGATDVAEVERYFGQYLYHPLWSGAMSPADFWHELLLVAEADGTGEEWERHFTSLLRPLPALARLHELRAADRIVILSNHVADWLRPLLADSVEAGLIDDVLISTEVGQVKPNLGAFREVLALPGIDAADEFVFVDDREVNLRVAATVGFDGVLAGPDGAWVAEVAQWLSRPVLRPYTA